MWWWSCLLVAAVVNGWLYFTNGNWWSMATAGFALGVCYVLAFNAIAARRR